MPSMTPGANALCGNGVVEAGEDCDDGGTCIGGSNAGTHCSAESDCIGNGVCIGGIRRGTDCTSNADCPGSTCQHCVPQGGDGCAANCTAEAAVPFNLAGSGGVTIRGSALTLPVPLSGSQTLTIGKPRNGQIPLIIKAASVQSPAVNVEGLACVCVRGIAAKTCGGTAFDTDGTPSTDCTLDDGACTGKSPCTAVHGNGNAAAGVIGCDGLDAVNVTYTQDSGGSDGRAAPPRVTFTGSGGPGSAVALDTIAIGTVLGACSGAGLSYGPDGQFCTADDPPSAQGVPLTLPFTTALATAEVFNADGQNGYDIGPDSIDGTLVNCADLVEGRIDTTILASAFAQLNEPVIGDVTITAQFAARPAGSPTPGFCCVQQAGSGVCVPIPCPFTPGVSTPTPTPGPIEGACYLKSSTCDGLEQQLTSQGACCGLLQESLPGPPIGFALSWCPIADFDQSTGRCGACVMDPCAGLPRATPVPTPPDCCDPSQRTPCPTAIACPLSRVSVDVGSAAGLPGATVTFDVTLQSVGASVAALQNDINFDPNTPITLCTANSQIGKDLSGFTISGQRLRAVVIGTDPNPIADAAVLYTCTVHIAASAAPGTYPLSVDNVIVADPRGNAGSALGTAGQVTVLAAGVPSPSAAVTAGVGGPPDGSTIGNGGDSPGSGCNLAPDVGNGAAWIVLGLIPCWLWIGLGFSGGGARRTTPPPLAPLSRYAEPCGDRLRKSSLAAAGALNDLRGDVPVVHGPNAKQPHTEWLSPPRDP